MELACAKALDEFLGLAYVRARGLPVVIVRSFNTIGPRQTGQYGMVIPRFVQQAYEGGFEDPRRRVPGVSKIRAAVGFVAAVDTTTSLEKVIRFYRR